MDDFDVLAPLKALFYLQDYAGLYKRGAADQGKQQQHQQHVAHYYMFRAQIAQGQLNSSLAIPPGVPHPSLAAVRLLAEHAQQSAGPGGNAAAAEDVVSRALALAQRCKDEAAATAESTGLPPSSAAEAAAEHARAAAAIGVLLSRAGRVEEACRTVHPYKDVDPECGALLVQCYLQLNRADACAPLVAGLKSAFPDAVPTLLAEAWTLDPKDAFYVYQELLETYGSTPVTQNGQAVCAITQGKLEEAERLLVEVKSADGLVNMLAVKQMLNRSQDSIGQVFMQLQQQNPFHPFLQEMGLKASLFDRCAAEHGAPPLAGSS